MTRPLRYGLAVLVIVAASVGLLLDLFNRGLVWQALYNVTGEESPPRRSSG